MKTTSIGLGIVPVLVIWLRQIPFLKLYLLKKILPVFKFPNGVPVIFEMEYNSNNLILVGVFIKNGRSITQHSILVLNPSDNEWKKAYVNLTPTVAKNPNADAFNVFIRADKESGVETATILLDNFKLIHRNTI